MKELNHIILKNKYNIFEIKRIRQLGIKNVPNSCDICKRLLFIQVER